jgi:hypothetical protein
VFSTIFGTALSITFKLEPESKKCVKDEVHKDVLVLGNYELTAAPMQRTDISIVDSQGHTLFTKDDISNGKFSFTTEDYEMFDICFVSTTQGHGGQGMPREVSLKIQHGGGNNKKYENVSDQLIQMYVHMWLNVFRVVCILQPHSRGAHGKLFTE